MSWSTTAAGRAQDVAAKIAKDLAPSSYDDGPHRNVKAAIVEIANGFAMAAPDLTLLFSTNGHLATMGAACNVTVTTFQPAPAVE